MLESHASRAILSDLVTGGITARILLVEDDAEMSDMLAETLREHAFDVAIVASANEMDAYLKRASADIVVLDVMLPGEDGFSICKRLRVASKIPIIMLTALDEEGDRVVGLEIGADDYVTKPFRSRELIARIRALLRRSQSDQPQAELTPETIIYRFAGWKLEPRARQLFNPDDVRVSLTGAEFDLLLAFCRNPGRVLAREQLLELMHGGAAGPIARSIDVHVSRVRKKIDPELEDSSFIKAVRLGGYIFTPSVETN